MPESLIAMTEGSGKNGHTFQRVIGANTVEDSVVLLGEPYLGSYIGFNGAWSTATANAHGLQIMAGATLKVRVRRIEIHQVGLATAATNQTFYICRLTTAGTGGIAVGVSPLDTADAGAGATAMTLPTVKGTEGAILAVGSAYLMQTAGASSVLPAPLFVWDFDRPRSKPLIIAAGVANGIAVVNQTGIAGATIRCNFWLDESNFG